MTLNVSPNRVGQNIFHITLKDENGQPLLIWNKLY